MGLKRLLLKPLSGYPGGYKKMRRGFQGFDSTPPFKVPDDPTDRRSRIPPTGFREYWYPALPAKDVKKNKPQMLRMLGADVVFFKDKQGRLRRCWTGVPTGRCTCRWAAATSRDS